VRMPGPSMPRPLRRHVVAAAFALLAGLAGPPPAHAQVEPIRLTYRAAGDCPAEARFVDAVQRRTARWQIVAEEHARAFDVDVSAGGSRSRGVLRITAPDGTVTRRAVAGASCAEVVSALALMTALAIDPSGSAEESDLGGSGAGGSGNGSACAGTMTTGGRCLVVLSPGPTATDIAVGGIGLY
jgi:hypothetical protein